MENFECRAQKEIVSESTNIQSRLCCVPRSTISASTVYMLRVIRHTSIVGNTDKGQRFDDDR